MSGRTSCQQGCHDGANGRANGVAISAARSRVAMSYELRAGITRQGGNRPAVLVSSWPPWCLPCVTVTQLVRAPGRARKCVSQNKIADRGQYTRKPCASGGVEVSVGRPTASQPDSPPVVVSFAKTRTGDGGCWPCSLIGISRSAARDTVKAVCD